ncbi:MAG TPA: hypothetical protein VFC16_00275 [Nakamurella sp.]|nr:hypothetical protein [Nakamurella sp.]
MPADRRPSRFSRRARLDERRDGANGAAARGGHAGRLGSCRHCRHSSLGDSTGQHRHEHDYIVIPVTGGRLSVTTPDGAVHDMTQVAGVSYLGTAGTTRTVTAINPDRLSFVEIELKP